MHVCVTTDARSAGTHARATSTQPAVSVHEEKTCVGLHAYARANTMESEIYCTYLDKSTIASGASRLHAHADGQIVTSTTAGHTNENTISRVIAVVRSL